MRGKFHILKGERPPDFVPICSTASWRVRLAKGYLGGGPTGRFAGCFCSLPRRLRAMSFVICVLSHTGARTRASWSHRTCRTEGLAGTVGCRCNRFRRFALFLRRQVSQQVFSLGFSSYAVSLQSRLAMARFHNTKEAAS